MTLSESTFDHVVETIVSEFLEEPGTWRQWPRPEADTEVLKPRLMWPYDEAETERWPRHEAETEV